MTALAQPLAGASSAYNSEWKALDWSAIERQVKRLQMRIAKAVQEGRHGRVKALQWILTHSRAAKLLAVKRVVENKGSKTAGVDGVVWRTDRQKMHGANGLVRRGYRAQPLGRVYIPKSNGQRRPLGIPTMKCRAMQALHLLGLEPVSETLADRNAYGFRPKRSTADAIGQCFTVLARKDSSQWILEGDIKSCFDKISHDWLRANVLTDKVVLDKWLKAEYVELGRLNPTDGGTPQGGIISPTLLTMTLRGLENVVKQLSSKSNKVHMVTYADDFIVAGASKSFLEQKVKPAIATFLGARGLELSEEKTAITHIDDGFDFLGFNVRK